MQLLLFLAVLPVVLLEWGSASGVRSSLTPPAFDFGRSGWPPLYVTLYVSIAIGATAEACARLVDAQVDGGVSPSTLPRRAESTSCGALAGRRVTAVPVRRQNTQPSGAGGQEGSGTHPFGGVQPAGG